jgi:tetratricopeptide (TPR) repeat protein
MRNFVFPVSAVAFLFAAGFSLDARATDPTPTSPAPAAAAPAPPAPDVAKPAATEGPRRDPRGVKGISPFWESIKKGDDALAARDLEGAKAAYQEAIRAEPNNGMGPYRIGEVELAGGHQKEAEASWQVALRFAGENATLKAKVLFVLADLRERQRTLDEATNGWNAYEAHVKAAPTAKSYPATAADRKKRITDWKQLETDYGAVKERIKTRLAEAEKKAAASAQSPQNR